MSILYLTEDEVGRLVTMDLALEAVAAAFRKIGCDEAENIPRRRCQTDLVMLHVLPAAAKTLGAIGFKAYTTSKQGARFHVTLFDPNTGAMAAVLEADLLGQFRTGAATGIATKKLARADAATVGCIGTGKQARTQLLAVCKVPQLKSIKVYGRDMEKRKAFAAASPPRPESRSFLWKVRRRPCGGRILSSLQRRLASPYCKGRGLPRVRT